MITYLLIHFLIGFGPSYLIGSIPFGLLLSKYFGKVDITKIGSGNIGATNVLRTGNKWLALATLLLDASKGVLAVLIPLSIVGTLDREISISFKQAFEQLQFSREVALIGGGLGIIGHCYPISYTGRKGGKGVATTLGVLLAAVPWAGVVACVTWGITAGFFRISSLSALVAVAVVPIATFLIYGAAPAIVTILIALLVFWRHKENIQRLLKGEEPKIGAKK